jgi:hypothetical protein
MERRGLERFAPLAGVLFLALGVVAFILAGESPGLDDSPREIVDYWKDDDSKLMVSAGLETLAALALVWFGASLRGAVAEAEGGTRRLANLLFAGFIAMGVGIATDAAIVFATADAADEASPTVIETLNALYTGFFFPLVLGLGLVLLALALAILRTGIFPKWLGWVLVVAFVVTCTPAGFITFLLSFVLFAVLGVVLFLREGKTTGPGQAAGMPGAGAPPPA